MRPIRVAVIDAHDVYRRGVVTCLAEDDDISLVYDGPTSPVEVDVDVMVCGAGTTTLPPDIRVVMLAGDPSSDHQYNDERIFAVLDRNGLQMSHLIEAVRATAVGLRIAPPIRALSRVNSRDHEVLTFLAQGAATREIAERLGYSERTVKEAIAHLKRLLGAKTRAQLVAEALRLRLI